ncbi:CD1871A family CXXC motif-containing protein [Olsenella sp. Marseille-P4559]|jgi:nitroimidazol reductase NimA-like FMN-containing flavoprotein (pyridoxamine 5'-phosphate oxidase superfamily)|uniref:CD1871A family CXXC motif-containing protein n=1 Tax=Olsenella sp. Marseille-P4559 TaxID=2364795 RepID=UPI0013EF3595|nr:CD1871A family CXXC motif-containing protein [Olsenella sp. Marseille-P4559]
MDTKQVGVLVFHRIRVIPILLMVLGGTFVAYGAYRGEVHTVLAKAIRICLECVGIG